MIEKYNLFKFKRFLNKELKKSKEIINISKIECYFNFLNSINLSSKSLFKTFDLDIFNKIFKCNFLDSKFQQFINSLTEDPLLYEKEDKIKVFYIYILAAIYCINNKIECSKLLRKINEISFLFKPTYLFDVPYITNFNIEKYIIQMKKITCDFDECIFLNKIYLNIKNNKDVFILFHKRFLDCCTLIDSEYLLSFLKIVFTYNTVLYNCIGSFELIKLIVSFYSGMSKIDLTLNILEFFYNNISDNEVQDYVKNLIKNLASRKPKYTKLCLEIEIRDFIFLNEFKDFIERNKESFLALNTAFSQLKIIKTFVTDEIVFELFEIYLFFFSSLKSEFVEGFLNQILNNIIILSEIILKNLKFDQSFVTFNLNNWSKLNDLILMTQRIVSDNDDLKKKKQSDNSKTGNKALVLKLLNLIYQIEDKAVENNLGPLVKLKKKGYIAL